MGSELESESPLLAYIEREREKRDRGEESEFFEFIARRYQEYCDEQRWERETRSIYANTNGAD